MKKRNWLWIKSRKKQRSECIPNGDLHQHPIVSAHERITELSDRSNNNDVELSKHIFKLQRRIQDVENDLAALKEELQMQVADDILAVIKDALCDDCKAQIERYLEERKNAGQKT